MDSLSAMVRVVARLTSQYGPVKATALIGRKWWRKLLHKRLPNTPAANRETWDTHNWSKGGEEWTPSPEWKQAVLDELLRPHIPQESRVLEIGPGGGRWTEELVSRCSEVYAVDISPVCVAVCRERFGDRPNLHLEVNDGSRLDFVPDLGVDAIWSFDVFVHIAPDGIDAYLAQFPRILAPGGVIVLHHAARGPCTSSWRSDMTCEAMARLAAKHGMEVVSQGTSLCGGRLNLYPPGGPVEYDAYTVMRRPPNPITTV